MRAVAAVLALVVVTGCASPSRTDRDYRLKAANTAESIVSAVQTARLAVRTAEAGKTFGPFLSQLLSDMESDANGIVATFESVQPPSKAADAVHDHLAALVGDAVDALRSLRVAARRGDRAALRTLADALAPLAEKLTAFEERPA